MALPKGSTTADALSEDSARSDRRVAGTGSYIVLAEGEHTGLNAEAIQPLAATTFTVYEENNVDQLANRTGGNELPAGFYGPAPTGAKITALTFMGGPVQVYHKSS